jgi:hypothetical protein
MTLIRYLFYFLTREKFEFVDWGTLLNAFFTGIRFDLLVLGFLLIPIVTLFAMICLSPLTDFTLKKIIKTYLSVVWVIIVTSSFISLPFYIMKERHFRYGLDKNIFIWPLVDITTFALMAGIFILILLAGLKTVWKRNIRGKSVFWSRFPSILQVLLNFLIPLLVVALAARGTVSPHHLEKAHSEISPWPHVNELVLNSVWCIDK